MLFSLKNHPFAVEAFFESSIVLTFAIDAEELRGYIPSHLVLDTLDNKWAFLAIAMVQTSGLRPKGFPAFLGNNFFLIGYRVFVKYKTRSGKIYRGLYIIKSETDKKLMHYLGNIFTHYNYSTTDIQKSVNGSEITINSVKSNFNFVYEMNSNDVVLPDKSPFKNWEEARKFAGPLPFTFSCNEKAETVLIVQGVRENWVPKPLKVCNFTFEFLRSFNFQNIALANAFIIENVPYYWKKGKIEKW